MSEGVFEAMCSWQSYGMCLVISASISHAVVLNRQGVDAVLPRACSVRIEA